MAPWQCHNSMACNKLHYWRTCCAALGLTVHVCHLSLPSFKSHGTAWRTVCFWPPPGLWCCGGVMLSAVSYVAERVDEGDGFGIHSRSSLSSAPTPSCASRFSVGFVSFCPRGFLCPPWGRLLAMSSFSFCISKKVFILPLFWENVSLAIEF